MTNYISWEMEMAALIDPVSNLFSLFEGTYDGSGPIKSSVYDSLFILVN